MANPANRAYLAARSAHKRLMGVTVTVSRGLNTSAPLTATVGFSGSVTYESDGSSLYTRNRDYLINIAEYNVGGDAVDPQKHDVITEVIHGVVRQFQVLESNGNGVSASSDSGFTVWRVHTKEM